MIIDAFYMDVRTDIATWRPPPDPMKAHPDSAHQLEIAGERVGGERAGGQHVGWDAEPVRAAS